MQSLIFTVVQNDMIGLDLWLSYYSKHFDKIVVLCKGTKPEYAQTMSVFKARYGIEYEMESSLTVPEEIIKDINSRQWEYLKEYKWVCFANVDEFLIPNKGTLKSLMDKKRKWIASECFDVLQAEDELPLDYSQPILKQRKYWIKNVSYNKIILTSIPVTWNPGLHQIDNMEGEKSKAIENTGLYLVHLKYADINAQNRDFGPILSTSGQYGLIKPDLKDVKLIPEHIKVV